MRGISTDVVGCPTGDAIRDLVRQRQSMLDATDSTADPDFYCTPLGSAERTAGIVLICEGSGAVLAALRTLGMVEVVAIDEVGISLLLDSSVFDRLVSREGYDAYENIPGKQEPIHFDGQAQIDQDDDISDLHHVIRFGGGMLEMFDSQLFVLDQTTTMRDWVRRNQPSPRPPRHVRSGKHQQK